MVTFSDVVTSIPTNLLSEYWFLSNNYEKGDQIFLLCPSHSYIDEVKVDMSHIGFKSLQGFLEEPIRWGS